MGTLVLESLSCIDIHLVDSCCRQKYTYKL